MKVLEDQHPDVNVHAASVTDDVSDGGTMLPGIGDVGDRLFGTGLDSAAAVPPANPHYFEGNPSGGNRKNSPISFEVKKKRKIEE